MGNIYITEAVNIRKIDGNTQIISVFAGGGGYLDDGIPATEAHFDIPYGIVGNTAGDIYYADAGLCCVRKITDFRMFWSISTIAGACEQCVYPGGMFAICMYVSMR